MDFKLNNNLYWCSKKKLGSDYMWLAFKQDACLQVKNIKNKNEILTSYKFGVALNVIIHHS